ncbi:MAG: hypothetical protein P8L78_17745 [Mariniblastus sp.]|nr:hypothetical protein [Mariniblastus sp.]MDG2183538.1 hypothetical protein [Mariniblastus sp.]
MIRKIVISLSGCCLILCGFVGYLSYAETLNSEKSSGVAVTRTCAEVLDKRPEDMSRVRLTKFVPGKFTAFVDPEQDDNWELACVPFFPPTAGKVGHGYSAVLVCFKNVHSQEDFKRLIRTGELDTNFWERRQKLDQALHSQLSRDYKNLDIANSTVLHAGFELQNPVLGETTLRGSVALGGFAILAAILALISGLFVRKTPKEIYDWNDSASLNRAGLPPSAGPTVLDSVSSPRSMNSH